jgi:hypothetical protein
MSVQSVIEVIAPQFKDNENLDTYIQLAECQTNRCWYGCKADLAVALRVAHTMTLNITRPNGDAGAIASKKEGDLSISYGKNSNNGGDSNLDQTHYGVQLQDLMKQGNAFVGITGGTGLCGPC